MGGTTQLQYAIYLPATEDQFTNMEIFRPSGRAEITEQYGSRSVVYVNNVDGTFGAFGTEEEPPGDAPTFTLTFFQEKEIKFIEKMANKGKTFNAQLRLYKCATLDNPTGWDRIWQLSQIRIGQRTIGEAPTVRAGGAMVESGVECTPLAVVDVAQLTLSALTNVETEDMLAIDGIKDLASACGAGYPGPDKVLVMSAQAAAGAKANVYFSINGGGTTTVVTADPAANDEHLGAIVVRPLGNGFRIVVARTVTDAGAPPEIWYATPAAFDATTIAAATWTAVNISAVNAGFVADRGLFWAEFNRLYAGLNIGDIYVSTNQSESWTLVYDGAVAIAGFARDKDGGVWAVGASNAILYESPSNRNVFAAKTGPAGGAAFTAIAVANDGTIFAGNGTALYRNNNNAGTAGGWTSVKDFGAGFAVRRIWFEGLNKLDNGESQTIRVAVDDTAPNDGSVWQSVDWGQTWQQVTTLANDGYNDAYWSKYGNHAIIVGDDNPLAIIHQLSQQ